MSKPIVFLPEAEDELRAAAEWYDDRAELGNRVVFVELDTEIRIVAIAHSRRRPGYWRMRVEGE